jgi:hypothetical protein
MADGDGLYSGEMNTAIIVAHIGNGGLDYAAHLCSKYSATQNGIKYGDWYLPSLWELNLIYNNKATIDATALGNGGSALSSGNYWSSTEEAINSAFFKNLSTGSQAGNNLKFSYSYVRAIRAF